MISNKSSHILPTYLFIYLLLCLEEKNTADVEKEEDMHNNFWSTRFLTPLDRFRGGVWYLSVSDLTAQYWCEQQMEYNFLAPESKPETEQMQLGKNIHLARGM